MGHQHNQVSFWSAIDKASAREWASSWDGRGYLKIEYHVQQSLAAGRLDGASRERLFTAD